MRHRSRTANLARTALLGLACLGVTTSCSDSDDDSLQAAIDAVCSAQCSKVAECDLLGGILTESQCRAVCKSDAAENTPDTCNPSQAELNACVSAIGSMSCTDLGNDLFPDECEDICSDGAPNDDSGISLPDSGIGFDFSLGDFSLGTDSSAGCSELSACCAQISDGLQKSTCESVANAGVDATCGIALVSAYGSLCPE